MTFFLSVKMCVLIYYCVNISSTVYLQVCFNYSLSIACFTILQEVSLLSTKSSARLCLF